MKQIIQYSVPFVFSLFILFSSGQKLIAQCSPPMAETCDNSITNLFCSLAELDGYACSNLSTIPGPCSPVCSQGGAPNNTSWVAFMTGGGLATITLNVGSCSNGQGIEFGIWDDCHCSHEVLCRSNPCTPPNSIKSATVNLTPNIYYLWVDGCNGDICNFTINTSGTVPPTLNPLPLINDDADKIIETCAGACFLFYVAPSGGTCQPYYDWTWNGVSIGTTEREFETDLPRVEGDYTICVTAYCGSGIPGAKKCAQQGPQCATVRLRALSPVLGKPRILCNEQTSGTGYKWHTQKIKQSGTYSEKFTNNSCCPFDSIVDFTVLDAPESPNVYYITCDNKPYTDILGKLHSPCLIRSQVTLPKTTDRNKCDSSILLTAINVNFAPDWRMECTSGKVELIPNVSLTKPCNAGETYEFQYTWYKKSDPKNILSNDERITVPSVSEDYCLQVSVVTLLGTASSTCIRTFCESFDESNLEPDCSFNLDGNNIYCFDPIATYRIDSLFSSKVNHYVWNVVGGSIISNPDSSSIDVKWTLNSNDTGKICASYSADCGTSCEKCLKIYLKTKIAGEDFEKRSLSAYLNALPNPNGKWKVISGPHQVTIWEPSNPKTRITAFNYGYYCFEWTIQDSNCTVRDTLCVNLHTYPQADPQYPNDKYLLRNKPIKESRTEPSQLFTSNLIDGTGSTHLFFNKFQNGLIIYNWYDMNGRVIISGENGNAENIQRMEIISPVNSGFYILHVEIDGIQFIRKVCVMN